MREIKFRAWSNEHNRYCDLIKMDEDDRWYGYIYSCAVYLSTKDIILEQYTGIKDKNGNSIWEGDILMDDTGEPIEYWVVKFSDGGFVGECIGIIENLFELTHLEIVGNINENPELLEEKK